MADETAHQIAKNLTVITEEIIESDEHCPKYDVSEIHYTLTFISSQ